MDENTRNKVAKLPVWARNLINQLEGEVACYQHEIETLQQVKTSRIYYGFEASRRGMMPIPDDGPVTFMMGQLKPENEFSRIRISYDRDALEPDKWLTVSSDLGALLVKPWASNMIKIKIEDR